MCIIPFPHTSNLQQTTLKRSGQNTENSYEWKHNYWIYLKTLRQQKKLLIMSNFLFCHIVFKSRLLHMCQNVSICGNGLNYVIDIDPCFYATIQQICSRQLKTSGQSYVKSLYKQKYSYQIKLKHWGKRRNFSFLVILSFCHNVCKSCLLQRHQKASVSWKG